MKFDTAALYSVYRPDACKVCGREIELDENERICEDCEFEIMHVGGVHDARAALVDDNAIRYINASLVDMKRKLEDSRFNND